MSDSTPEDLSVRIYRYSEAGPRPGLSVGVTRFLPRGVRRYDYAIRGYFDVWLPLLAPSRELIAALRKERIAFNRFARQYRAEMRQPETKQVIRLLAAMARCQPVYLGCFCTDASRCHRTVLRDLVVAALADLPELPAKPAGYFSPACSMPEIED